MKSMLKTGVVGAIAAMFVASVAIAGGQEQRQGEQGPPADAKLRQELEAELLADVPNDQKIDDLKQQILAAQAEGLSRHIAVQKQIAQVLTAEQRAKARATL